jgi:peptidoglycan hydrolase-like protein with peptidoglycan-binding domain
VPDYGLDDSIDDADPDLDDNGPSEDPATPSAVLPDEANSLVSSVQRELTTLGYYQGPIDGVSGPQTEDALRWFQAVNHLPVTGRIDGATVQALHLA